MMAVSMSASISRKEEATVDSQPISVNRDVKVWLAPIDMVSFAWIELFI